MDSAPHDILTREPMNRTDSIVEERCLALLLSAIKIMYRVLDAFNDLKHMMTNHRVEVLL